MSGLFDRWLRIFKRAGPGERGERLAADWLRRERAFRIVARNWRSPRDRRNEIDLVARDGEVLVFVEVKARAAGALVSGYHAVDARKRAVMRRAIEAYLAGLRVKPVTVRFDIVEVALPAAGSTAVPEVRHFENIPLLPPRGRP
ncbi:MAG TPA: YraN family protein [Opitutaceae bacterium]|nr:YraN family protein [Opitutaceae bacterium]